MNINSSNDNHLITELSRAINEIKYGQVELVIQDSKVIQLNKTEKVRLDSLNKRSSS